MTHQEILTKAIQKAIDGGWKFFPDGEVVVSDTEDLDGIVFEVNSWPPHWIVPLFVLIYNHDFAKALWGVSPARETFNKNNIYSWAYHLQQMVIAEDPIAYLGANLPQ